jgi:phenylacetate-coenzyme A ligase PaaK-like adenylate-forming protein
MKNSHAYLFGKIAPLASLQPSEVSELLKSAAAHASLMAEVPNEKILTVLGRVSQIWKNAQHPLRIRAQKELPALVRFSPEMVAAGLDVVAALCDPENIARRLEGEFGPLPPSPEWVDRPRLHHQVRVLPRGPVLHLAAGNVFVGVVDSLVSGIITRNANILKMSQADPFFPGLFLESLQAADPEGLIWPHQAVVLWKGGDRAIEAPLLRQCGTVMFWGGREALLSVRSHIGAHTRLIENGPRYSFAVTDRETLRGGMTEDMVRGLALDICRWDQQACSSPHVLYAIGADREDLLALLPRLESELNRLALELPLGPIDFDEKVELRRVRELAHMDQAKDLAILHCPATFTWTMIYEEDPVFKISCLNRTLFLKRVPDVAGLLAAIAPLTEYLQTVGVAVAHDFENELTEVLLRAGARRLTEWGGMSEGRDGAPHEGVFLLTRLVDIVSREYTAPSPGNSSPSVDPLLASSGMSSPFPEFPAAPLSAHLAPPASPVLPGQAKISEISEMPEIPEIPERVARRLELLLSALERSPFYRSCLPAPKNNETTESRFKRVPLMDRQTFYRHSPPESEAILTGPATNAYVYASGGTTGRAKYALYSVPEYRFVTDVLADLYRTAGIEAADRVGNLFLAGNLWTSFNVAGRALENIGCLGLPIGGMTEFDNLAQYLGDWRVNTLIGLPSVMVRCAEEVKKRGLPIRIEKILYGGEHLRPATRAFLQETLGCQWIRSAGYACVDTGPLGFQCPHVHGAIHHVLDTYAWVEIMPVSSDPGVILSRECAENEPGEIVATNLDRLLMPVVRYRTGDLGRWVPVADCPCGFLGRSFELLGRCDDMLMLGGIILTPVDLAPGLAQLPVSPNFQMIARNESGKDVLVLRLENDERGLADEGVITALTAGCFKLAEALKGNWLVLRIEWFPVGGVPRQARTGKLKVVIDER